VSPRDFTRDGQPKAEALAIEVTGFFGANKAVEEDVAVFLVDAWSGVVDQKFNKFTLLHDLQLHFRSRSMPRGIAK